MNGGYSLSELSISRKELSTSLEIAWVERARTGDEESLRELIELHRVNVIRTAFSILRDQAEAEDVAQEAFLKAFKQLGRLREDQFFRRFLYRITINLSIDALRKRKRTSENYADAVSKADPDIESRIAIESILEKLPNDLRIVLVLREIEQMNYQQIATILDIPVGTVRSRLHVAREKFRQHWSGERS